MRIKGEADGTDEFEGRRRFWSLDCTVASLYLTVEITVSMILNNSIVFGNDHFGTIPHSTLSPHGSFDEFHWSRVKSPSILDRKEKIVATERTIEEERFLLVRFAVKRRRGGNGLRWTGLKRRRIRRDRKRRRAEMLAVAVKRYHWFPSGVEAPMAMATCYHSPASLSLSRFLSRPGLLRRPLFSLSPFHPLSLARFSAASR